MKQVSVFNTFITALLLPLASTVFADPLPCGVESFRLVGNGIEVRFGPRAYWFLSPTQLPMVNGRKIIDFDEKKSPDPIVSDMLLLTESKPLHMWIPHISCTLKVEAGSDATGVSVMQNEFILGATRRQSETAFIPVGP